MSPVFASIEPKAFRKKRNLWLAYATEMAAPLFRQAARARARGAAFPPREWRRGLIIGHSHIGDLLYRTCSLPVLREYLPGCEWSYLVRPDSQEVLDGNPHVREVLPLIKGENSWELVDGGFEQLRSRRFDAVLCSNTLRHYPDLLLAASIGIPSRIGFAGKGFSGLMTQSVDMHFPDAYASYFRTMVAAVLDRPADWELRPRLYPGESNNASADKQWNDLGLGHRPVIACALRTRQARGNWPQDVILSILETARRRQEFDVVFCGSASDAGDLRQIAGRFPFPAQTFAGGSILTFAAFLRRCSALLTLDSGPRHIGNAMGIPVLFARNLSHSRIEAGRYCATETDLAPPVEYLGDDEATRVAQSQPVPLLAETLLSKLSS